MLITETTRTIVHVASLVVGIAGAIAAARHLRRFSRKVPTAMVHAKQSFVARALRLFPILGMPLGIAAFFWATSHKIEVLVVRDGHSVHGSRVFEHKLGSAPLEASVAKGNEETKPLIGRPCWTVNGSSKPIRIVRIQYPTPYKHYVETESVTVLPGQRASDCHFDYYGPEFAPPETADSMSNPRWNFASWLTWDEHM